MTMKNKTMSITIILCILFAGSLWMLFIESSLLLTDYIAPTILSIFSGIGLLISWYKEKRI